MKKPIDFRFQGVMGLLMTFCLFALSCKQIDNITYEELKDDLAKQEQEDENNFFDRPSISLFDLLSGTQYLSQVSKAFMKAGLDTALKDEGPFTLFVPNNNAVQELFDNLGFQYNSFEDFDSPVELEILNRILSYHMIPGNLESDDLVDGQVPTLYAGNSIGIKTSDNSFVLSDASSIEALPLEINKKAANGVIHVINKIMLPEDVITYLGSPNLNNTAHKTIKELIVENEDFILLKEALILTDLLNLLDEEGPYTVFAPANETFIGLLGYFNKDFSNLENLTGEAEIALLREVLLYHVLGSRLQSNEFVLGSIPTLSGSNTLAMVNQDDEGDQFSLVDALHLEANFDVKDIQAKNGVIHTIDRILIPESAIEKLENQIAIAVEMAMIDTGDLNIALDLFKMVQNDLDLQELAKNEFTFFLPSDQAFLNLFNDLGIDAVAGFNNEAGSQLLAKILGYHLIENKRLKLSQLATGQKFTTAQGEDLEVAISSDIALIDKSGMPSRIILTNQEVFKGIIHVVDKVLLPTEVLDSL